MIRKLINKVAFTIFAVAVFCNTAYAAVVESVRLYMGQSVAVNTVAGCDGLSNITDETAWNAYSGDPEFATVTYDSGKKTFVINGVVDGDTQVIIKNKSDSSIVYAFKVRVVTLEVTKKIINQNKEAKTATVQVDSHYLCGRTTAHTPKVLFLGTLCGTHATDTEVPGLTISKVIVDSLNAVASKAAVDYFLYQPGCGWSTPKVYGSVAKGKVVEDKVVTTLSGYDGVSAKHAVLEEMLGKVNSLRTSGSQEYD